MQEKDVKDLPGGVAWTGVADRKDEVQEESWYQVWGRGLWAEIRSDAWYLEAMLYAIFLILLTWVAANAQDQSILGTSTRPHYILQRIRKGWGEPFNAVRTPNDWYDFIDAKLLPSLMPSAWYNGVAIPEADRGWAGENGQDDLRLIGAISIRQVRVQPNTCPTTFQEEFQSVVPICFGEYTIRFQDVSGFGPVLDNGLERYLFSDQTENGEDSFTGQVNTYDGGGFRIVIPTDGSLEEARATVAQMKQDRWIDRQTRAVFVSFNLFSPANKYVTVVRFLLELPPSGGFLPKMYTRHTSVARLALKDAKIATLWAEVLMIFLTIGFVIIELREVNREGLSAYLSGPWFFLDFATLALFFSAYGFRYAALVKAPDAGFPTQPNVFMNLEPPAFCVDMWRNLLGVTVAVAWFKSIKYARHIPFLVHAFNCFFLALPDMVSFFLVSFIIFFGFALAHFMVYANDMQEFSTLAATMLTLWKQAMGDLSARPLEQRFSYSGSTLFVTWTLVSLFVLLNGFLGLLKDAFTRLLSSGERVTLGGFLRRKAVGPLRTVFQNQFLKLDETAARADTVLTQDEITREVEARAQEDEEDTVFKEDVVAEEERAKTRRATRMQERKGVLLQALLTLSRETSVISRRLNTLQDTEAPLANDDEFFD